MKNKSQKDQIDGWATKLHPEQNSSILKVNKIHALNIVIFKLFSINWKLLDTRK